MNSPLSNCSNTPVETLDQEFDFFRVLDYSLRPDSGGAGTTRGGLGFRRRFLITGDRVELALYSDRFRRAPDGLFGGAPGTTGYCRIERDGAVIEMPSKGKVKLQPGDVVELAMGGGGGYGPASARHRDRLAADLAERYVTG